jgi:integrase
MTPADITARLERYLALRRALGTAMHAEERLLREFVASLTARSVRGPHCAPAALDWACAGRGGPGWQARRLSVARGFLAHLGATDPTVAVPGPGLLARAVRPQPHLLSEAALATLLRGARALGSPGVPRLYTLATVIGLLASTGLRAGEALRLCCADVDLTAHPPRVAVRETKFRKSRLVPLHPTTAAALRAYATRRRRVATSRAGDAFFVSERGTPLSYHGFARAFVEVARRLGLRGPGGAPGLSPRALRHTFAVRRVLAWYRAGADVAARLPELAVYLGHVRPQDTYWYLTATPDVLRAAAARLEAALTGGGER